MSISLKQYLPYQTNLKHSKTYPYTNFENLICSILITTCKAKLETLLTIQLLLRQTAIFQAEISVFFTEILT